MRTRGNRSTSALAVLALLAGSSALLYLLQLLLFRRPQDTAFYLLQDAAFLPVQAALVTFVLNALLARREKRHLLRKLSMVIGAFYVEVGNRLLTLCVAADPDRAGIRAALADPSIWAASERLGRARVKDHPCVVIASPSELEAMKSLLDGRRPFVMGLLQNPNLLERESFTEALLAVVHLTEELGYRERFAALPAADLSHLAGDVGRAYRLLLAEWAGYVAHLKGAYPYMFSLVARTHPFREAAPVVT